MILAIDCGNTNTVFALYSYNNTNFIKKQCCWRIYNNSKRTADSYFSWLSNMFDQSNFKFDNVTGVCIASVVPETLFNIKT